MSYVPRTLRVAPSTCDQRHGALLDLCVKFARGDLVLEDGEYTSNVEGAYPGLVVVQRLDRGHDPGPCAAEEHHFSSD